jgi:hypothetical protein
MKRLIWLLTITLFATTALPQRTAGQKAPPDLQIVSYSFDPGFHTTRITNNGFNFPGINNTDLEGGLLRYDATIVVKNNGSRNVKAFTLGIVFVDLETKNEVEHRKVYLRKSLVPMAEKTLSRSVLRTNRPGSIIVKAVIDRVEYDDGSVWQRP